MEETLETFGENEFEQEHLLRLMYILSRLQLIKMATPNKMENPAFSQVEKYILNLLEEE